MGKVKLDSTIRNKQNRPRAGLPVSKHEIPGVKSLARALDLLNILGENDAECSLGKIAHESKLPPSTVHRLLHSLQQRSFVVQNKITSNYTLGDNLILLGRRAERQRDLRTIARPCLEDLARETRETVNLTTLVGHSVVQLDHIDSPNILKVTWDAGLHFPVHASASGKIFLAHLPSDERDKILKSIRFQSFTQRTIVDAKKSRLELDAICRHGFAIDDAEREEGVRCIAAPVFNAQRRVIAAISVSGPSLRLSLARLEALAEPVMRTASEISTALGYHAEKPRAACSPI
jgi:DNA-binding IclR family transcriptional regulator